jgi:hypothetical protein
MDRYSILLKKKPNKNVLSFFDRMRGIFGTKYPIKINVVANLGVPLPVNNFFYYDATSELFSRNPIASLPFFVYRSHRYEIRAVFKTVEKDHHIKDIMIYRQGQSENIGIILNIDKIKSEEEQREWDRADEDSRYGYGRSER